MGTPLDQLIAIAFATGIERIVLSMTSPGKDGFRNIQAAAQSEEDIRNGNYRVHIAPNIVGALKPVLEDRRSWELQTKMMELRIAVEEYSARLRRNGA